MSDHLTVAYRISSLIFGWLFLLGAAVVVLVLLGRWVSILVWCLPLTASLIILLVAVRFFACNIGSKTMALVGAISSSSYLWATLVIEPNLSRLPKWLLVLLAMPLNPGGSTYDGRGHREAGLDMAGLRGVILIVSIVSLLCTMGFFIDAVQKRKKPKSQARLKPRSIRPTTEGVSKHFR